MRDTHENGPGAPRRSGVLRRRSGPRKPLAHSDSDRIAAVAAGADVPVEDVLREVADFRLALETDMIIAAAAVDAEAPELLSDVLDEERLELATFQDRLLDRLADAAASTEIALRRERRRPRRAPKVAVAAAAFAIFGIGLGQALPAVTRGVHTRNVAALATADQQYANFSSAVTSNSSLRVRNAARELHQTLAQLISQHASDPEVARRTAQLLQAEISLLQMSDPAGASQVIAQARTLVKRLEAAAPSGVRASVAPVLNAVSAKPATPKPKPSPSATPSPKPSPKPSATPSPTPYSGPLHTP